MTQSRSPSSFSSKFLRWRQSGASPDLALEQELRETYRRAWETGTTEDRLTVLDFVFLTRDSSGFDLVIRGIEEGEETVAADALAIASSLMVRDVDLGPGIRASIGRFSERFPNLKTGSWAALVLLDAAEERRRRG